MIFMSTAMMDSMTLLMIVSKLKDDWKQVKGIRFCTFLFNAVKFADFQADGR